MKPSTGPTPLFALEGVALDTETTGLDPAKALIVQLGTINLSRNRLVEASAWERIVDPGIVIPEPSVRIHGITSAMAREAPRLRDVWAELATRIEGRVLVGHSIGFDLAVLAAEAQRHRLHWPTPRALDVRLLAQIVAPTLADHSLDALASWLGLKVHDRHQALGDARTAGEVFAALVPLLEEKGIKTLAEAERASQNLRPEIERQENAGWAAPVSGLVADSPLAKVDSYPYRHQVGDVMSSPVAVVTKDTTLKSALDLMVERGFSSVFVSTSGKAGEDVANYSILTERDAARQISASGADALSMPVAGLGSSPVATVRDGAFVYRAVARMRRLRYRHLGVRSDDNRLVGVISARDLLKLRTGAAIELDDAIEEAENAADMAVAWASLPTVARALVDEDVDATLVCQIVSEEIRAMTTHAATLALRSMAEEGMGAPPCGHAVMVLGSGGRGESMLVPDQDNAIVFETGEPDGEADRWFADMATRMNAILNEAGIPLCQGGVMAKNAQWRGSFDTWRERIDDWVRRSRPEDLLNVDIFFDAMPVHGDFELGNTLFREAYQRGHESAPFAKLLGESLNNIPNPFSMFGGLSAPENRLDLKLHGLFPIAACARLLAIRHNITERSTRARLEALIERVNASVGDLDRLQGAHELFMGLVLENQGRDIASGLKASNRIDLSKLSSTQKSELKQSLHDVQIIPSLVRDLMFG